MPYEVKATPVAEMGIAQLRGPAKQAFERFKNTLALRGCAAFPAAGPGQRNPQGYRLTGEEPLPSLCVRHLRGKDRAVVAFVGDRAWILLVGPHDEGDQAANVYRRLYELLGLDIPTEPRTKPACCDEDSSAAPQLDEVVIAAFIQRARRLRNR